MSFVATFLFSIADLGISDNKELLQNNLYTSAIESSISTVFDPAPCSVNFLTVLKHQRQTSSTISGRCFAN